MKKKGRKAALRKEAGFGGKLSKIYCSMNDLSDLKSQAKKGARKESSILLLNLKWLK